MKLFRIFFKGSSAEKNFINKQKDNGYVLEKIHFNFYTFKKDSNIKDTTLQIEYKKDSDDFEFENNKCIAKMVVKNLALANYKVIYSYITSSNDYLEVLNDTNDIEIDYLTKLRNRLLTINVFSAVGLILLWFFLIINDMPSLVKNSVIGCVFLVWLIISIFSKKLSNRLDDLGDEENVFSPEITVIITTNSKEKPNLEKNLSALGHWRYVTTKQTSHYFRLSSSFSEEVLKNEISSYLSIPIERIQIIPNVGLFPIGRW